MSIYLLSKPCTANRYGHLFVAMGVVCLLLLCSSCGKKASPVPPGTLRPRAVDDLSFSITPDGAVLTWTIPEKNMDGSPILHIEGFRLFRAESPVDAFCQGCPPAFGGAIEIPFSIDPDNAGRMSYEDRTLQTETVYTYEVMTIKGLFNISDPSNRVVLSWHPPPEPPKKIEVIPVVNGIKLLWSAPDRWTNGSKLNAPLTFEIMRRKEGSTLVNSIADRISGNEFFDNDISRSKFYRYRIIAHFHYINTDIMSVSSNWSEPAGILDSDAPEAPENVIASVEPEGVVIRWDASVEPDLFGYNIYRLSGDGLAIKLNTSPVIMNRFVDRTKLISGRYSYRVTAVDNSVVSNESAMSEPVSVILNKNTR